MGQFQQKQLNLEVRLKEFKYWQERFDQYKLSPTHLKDEQFNFDQINKDKILSVNIAKLNNNFLDIFLKYVLMSKVYTLTHFVFSLYLL